MDQQTPDNKIHPLNVVNRFLVVRKGCQHSFEPDRALSLVVFVDRKERVFWERPVQVSLDLGFGVFVDGKRTKRLESLLHFFVVGA